MADYFHNELIYEIFQSVKMKARQVNLLNDQIIII